MSQGGILEGKEDKGRYEEREERGGQQRPKILRSHKHPVLNQLPSYQSSLD